jgi:hypothetical protein
VNKEVQVVEKLDQFPVPDLNPKNESSKKQNAGIAKHQITKSHTTPINMNCSKVLQ